MVNRLVRGITLPILLFFITASLAATVAFAQNLQTKPGEYHSDKLELVVRGGYGRVELRGWGGLWTPFRIMLANQGEAISGRLIVVCKDQNGPGRQFVKPIQLPTGSRQLHEMTVYLNSGEDVEVRLEANGGLVASTTVEVDRQSYNSQVVVAIVDNDSTALNSISNMEMPLTGPRKPFDRVTAENSPQSADATAGTTQTIQTNTNPSQNAQNRRRNRNSWGNQDPSASLVVVSPEDLPRDFIAYNPVDVVVLGDAPLSQLSEDQARALKYWVASGGMLIITGATDLAGLHASKLDSILPVDVQSSTTVPALAELTDIYGQFENKDNLLILAARGRPQATILVGTSDRPIVAESKYGNGIVRFLAYNPKLNPYRNWAAAKHLWTDLLRPAAETKAGPYMWGRGNSSSLQDNLYKMAEIKPTSSSYFLFFLLAYVLVVGPINYLVLRWKKKLDLAWVSIPAVVVLFTIVSLTIAQINKEGAVAADSSLVEYYQREGIQQTRGGFLIRSDSTGRQNVTLEGREFYAIDSVQNGPPTTSENLEVEQDTAGIKLKIPTTNGAAAYFQIRAVSENQKPLAVAQVVSATAVRIKNLGDTMLADAVYVSSLGVSDPVSLEPGEEKQVALNVPQAIRFSDWYQSHFASDSLEYSTFEGLASLLGRGTARAGRPLQGFFGDAHFDATYKAIERPMVLGFMDKNSETIAIDGMSKRRSKTFYIVHL